MADNIEFVDTAPSHCKDTGTKGQVYLDLTNRLVYVCVATNYWIRAHFVAGEW